MTTLGELTPNDLGKEVRIETHDAAIQGRLNAFNVDVDWVMDHVLSDAEPTYIVGSRTVRLTVGPWETSRLPIQTEVTFP